MDRGRHSSGSKLAFAVISGQLRGATWPRPTFDGSAKIGAYRVFQNWVDDHRAADFKRVNVCYGQNGSGKSTLAALLRECAAHEHTPPSVDLALQVDLAGSTTEVTETTEAFWSRLRVFNSDYVAESLRFEDVDGPSPDSLLTLGKPNVEAEFELRSAIDRMAEVRPALAAAKNQAQRGRSSTVGAVDGTGSRSCGSSS